MRLVITEKPSVARDLARVLGVRGKQDGYLEGEGLRISWCFGHMAELEDPAAYDPAWKRWDPELLPMLPEVFSLRVRKGSEDQVKILKRLLLDKQTTEVVNACDAGREGELIFRWLLEVAGAHKRTGRLWVSSMTDEAIRLAWSRIQASERYDPLADAARCRAEADWLVGLNATRAMTCLARSVGGGQLLSVGRVQTPTLAMIVGRDAEIEAFVPEDFWQVRGRFQPETGAPFKATWFQKGGLDGSAEDSGDDEGEKEEGPARTTRLPSLEAAEALAAAARGQVGEVVKAERRRTRERPPLLYDLTSLQRRANQRYGLSAAQTLEIAQALSERHQLITDPRTDARHLTPDQVGELPGIVEAVGRVPVYAPFAQGILGGPIEPGRRVVDAAEVGDHHAILPTARTPESGHLSPDEKRIYDLVARRLLAALSPDALFDVAEIEVSVSPAEGAPLPEGVHPPLSWRARGRICVEVGWQAVDPPKKRAEIDLPPVEVGDRLDLGEVETVAGRTRPPPPHTDASILAAMETAGKGLDDVELRRAMRQSGLGTPATRAAILTTLQQRQFVVREGKAIHATERGRALIAAVPVDELKNAELTGRWEARLAAIAEGKEQRGAFMEAVRIRTGEICAAILGAEPPPPEVIVDDREVLGACPICGSPVKEGRGAWSCEKGRACTFVIFKKVAKREVSRRSALQLLREGKTPVMKGFKSKAGKAFEAALALDAEGRVTFSFPPREAPPVDPTGQPCPQCGQGRVLRGRAAFGCSRWREGCGWRRPFGSA